MKQFWAVVLFLFALPCFADVQPLPPQQAFAFSANVAANNSVQLQWQIAPNHYLYRERLDFHILQSKNSSIGNFTLPPAIQKQDDILGKYQVYTDNLSLTLPIINPGKNNVVLAVSYQGCSEDGYCYPPMTHLLTVNFAQNIVSIDRTTQTALNSTSLTQQNKIEQLLQNKHLYLIIFGFLGFGLLLAFTPCVLPMMPILYGIILGHGHHISHGKAFRLSLTYVLSMSFTYAIAGLLVGYIGGTLQVIMQKPWVIILFSIIYIIMAISMFGFFNLQPPQKLENFLAKLSAHQHKGHYIGVAIMGCIATLIISPCVTPALIAAIAYIGQSGDILIGGVALFFTGLGMGIPLLLVGTSTKLLPKTGHWMNSAKYIIGIVLLAMAILLLSRILPGPMILLLWAMLLIGCALFMGVLTTAKTKWQNLLRAFAVVLLVYGIMLVIGAAMGHSDPLKPFARSETATVSFNTIKTTNDLSHALAIAKSQNKFVMLDFYADWCISCKEMDRTTFSDENVKNQLRNFMVLRADITKNDDADKALMQQFGVIAPPTVLFFSPNGTELENLRIVGETSPTAFIQILQQIH